MILTGLKSTWRPVIGGPVDLQALRVNTFLSWNEGLIPVDVTHLFSFVDKPGPELGMSYGYEVHGPLSYALSLEVGYAVLRHHVMDIAPGKGDPSPFLRDGTILDTVSPWPWRAGPGWSFHPEP